MANPELNRAVIFDYNGTLNDMEVVLEQDIYVGQVEFGLELTRDDVVACWGKPAEEFYTSLFGRGGDTRTWQEMREAFRRHDRDFPRRLLPGVLTTLNLLDRAGVVTGVVTDGPRDAVLKYMHQSRLDPNRFAFVHTSREVGGAKRRGEPVLGKALQELDALGIVPPEVVFVGDEPVNMRDASAAGTDFVIVSSGTVSRENLLEAGVPPARLIDNLHQLPGLLGLSLPGKG